MSPGLLNTEEARGGPCLARNGYLGFEKLEELHLWFSFLWNQVQGRNLKSVVNWNPRNRR